MRWTPTQVEHLISLVREYPYLFDNKNVPFKNKGKRLQATRNIAEIVSQSRYTLSFACNVSLIVWTLFMAKVFRNPQQGAGKANQGISSLNNYETYYTLPFFKILQENSAKWNVTDRKIIYHRKSLLTVKKCIGDTQMLFLHCKKGPYCKLNGLKILRRSDGNKVIEGQRVTVIVKLWFSLHSVDGKVTLKLFVTDLSLSALNSRDRKSVLWIPFIIKPSCSPPPILKLWLSCSSLSNPVPVMCLQDIKLCGGELIGDRYSCIFLANENGMKIPSWMGIYVDLLSFTHSSLVSRVSSIKSTSMPGEVVSITGNVVGVDEETAFSWPACNTCGNDHLSEVKVAGNISQQPAYHYARFQSLVDKPFTNMSLDAFLACYNLPPERCRIKVKLYQKSIMELLPPCNEHARHGICSRKTDWSTLLFVDLDS